MLRRFSKISPQLPAMPTNMLNFPFPFLTKHAATSSALALTAPTSHTITDGTNAPPAQPQQQQQQQPQQQQQQLISQSVDPLSFLDEGQLKLLKHLVLLLTLIKQRAEQMTRPCVALNIKEQEKVLTELSFSLSKSLRIFVIDLDLLDDFVAWLPFSI